MRPALQTLPAADIDFTNCLPAERIEVLELADRIAAEYHARASAIIWRDAFCHDCEQSECLRGTALQLNIVNLNCPRCTGYDEWKDA